MATVTVYDKTKRRSADPDDLKNLIGPDKPTVWIDMTGPTDEDLVLLRDVFKFHPLAIEDTRNHWQRGKVDEYADYLFTILNPVEWGTNRPLFRELDVFTGCNYVVTVHRSDEPLLENVQTRIERMNAMPSSGFLLYAILDIVVDGYFPVLDLLAEQIEDLGDQVLEQPNQKMLNHLFDMKKTLVDMWRILWPQRDIPNKIMHHDLPFLDEEALNHYLRDVSDHLMWIAEMVSTFRDTLTGTLDLYMSAVSNRLNKVVNRLTIVTVLIGLLTVISGFYGMNFNDTWPPFGSDWGVPFVLTLMVGLVTGLLLLFKKLDWL
ncbi:MAG TPA: magnesium/cobalt transporter CorA [Aggregatilinea sp.]|uniref:magnesium/cobalt transporter CorA n=1 Tax=Aggregatilinea sp. TaxID=2806333 RepID=UPI002B9EA644|nr:magnesium/cobalt transporter CorA [Aggregatilinea sp.]HML22768.1 magnesium/cobalt transporter CorA [Aggregatilinea sp.]